MERIADNLQFELAGDILTLTIDIGIDMGVSKSGKSRVISSTRGNIAIPGKPELKLGVNLYEPIPVKASKTKGDK